VSSANCRLCVAHGCCDQLDPSPVFKGNALHRVLTCQSTEAYRQKHAPKCILNHAQLWKQQGCSLLPHYHDLVTGAIQKLIKSTLQRHSSGSATAPAMCRENAHCLSMARDCSLSMTSSACVLDKSGHSACLTTITAMLLRPRGDRQPGQREFMELSSGVFCRLPGRCL